MCVERRYARLAAACDAAVGDRTIRFRGLLHIGVVDVDTDSRRHCDRLAVEEHVEMRVDVISQEFLRLGLQSGYDCPLERIGRGGPEDCRIGI